MFINNYKEFLILISPLIVCFGASFICKIKKNAGSSVIFRPPSWIFGIIWSILFILLGISFLLSVKNASQTTSTNNQNYDNILEIPIVKNITVYVIYIGIITTLASWIITYGCADNKITSLWTFIPIFMFTFMGLCIGNTTSKILLCPLIAWLIFAILLGSQELHNISKHN